MTNADSIRFGDGNWLTNFYSAENRLSGVRLPSGTLLTNFFDFAGRLTNRQAKISGVVTETASFEYNGHDAVTRMTDDTGSTTNLFDAAKRLWGIDYPSGASVRYQLDLLDRISAVTNKATAGGTAYVTRYQRDTVGNVTNVIDPFSGNTSFEYDRVGRRTKRTLPNGIVTEWQYNWRDRVTNITHKIGSTTLASVGYERLPGGEPSKITREDGTRVELKYDSALRLTNEIYFTNSVALTTNSYAYDASGSRIKLVQGNMTLTNSVSSGYQTTAVKDAATGNTTNSYAYDAGGRVTQIVRDGATLNLGYNTADQVRAVTNGATWVTYAHDASGRRTIATNNGAIRLFMTAPVPGSDLESPHAVFTESGGLRKGYVYVEGQPLCRYDGGGRVFYLEDGMGSVIGLAPESNPDLSNTSRLFYDGFGNVRATGGPAPTFGGPGIRGDFRFHGQWLEGDTGLYHMRAREYDARMGRFTSRDPAEGEFKEAESFHPYVFANNNTYVYSDPSGQFTLIEISLTTAIQAINHLSRVAGGAVARRSIIKSIGKWTARQMVNYLQSILPIDEALINALGANDFMQAGRDFQRMAENLICAYLPIPSDWLWLEPRVRGRVVAGGPFQPGDVFSNGIGCGERSTAQRLTGNIPRPDFIISPGTPRLQDGTTRTGLLIGDFKLSGRTFQDHYLGRRPRQEGQWNAMTGYARRHSYTRMVLLVSLRGMNKPISTALFRAGAARGVIVIPVGILK